MVIFVTLILLVFPLDVVSKECPKNSAEWRQRETIPPCPGGTSYHCLPDENGLATEICLEKTWVQPGFCPEFNSMSKKMDVSLCQESRGKCPLRTYWSNDAFMYSACMSRNYVRNGTFAVVGTIPKTTTSRSAYTERNTNGDNGNEEASAVVVPLILGIIVLCVVAAAVLLYVWYRRRSLANDRNGKPEEPDTTSPLMIAPSMLAPSTTDDGKLYIEREAKHTETENYSKDKKKTVQASDRKKLSKDDKFEYSAKIAEDVGPRLKKNGILLLVCHSKPLMAELGQLLALTCDTQEFPSGFKEFLNSFVEMEKNNQKTKCVVFNDCFQKDRDTIKLLEYKSVFNELYEKQIASEGRLRFVIAIPMTLWNARNVTLSTWNLFNEKYIFKINNPPF